MKILGIDYGTKRVGIAISDENEIIAIPKEVVRNDDKLVFHIVQILKEENITELVIGESLDTDGNPNIILEEIESFISKVLEEVDINIFREKEFFTSFEAHDRQGKERNNDRKTKINKTKDLDAKAAAIILQRYLDRINL
jgi:putative Holliday junction resolvase